MVQVYLGVPVESQPPKRLVGFKKVFVQPGESKQVTITIDPAATNHPFGVWDYGNTTLRHQTRRVHRLRMQLGRQQSLHCDVHRRSGYCPVKLAMVSRGVTDDQRADTNRFDQIQRRATVEARAGAARDCGH